MLILGSIGLFCLILGAMFIFGKDTLNKLDALMNKTVFKLGGEPQAGKDKIVGVFLVLFALALFAVALTLKG